MRLELRPSDGDPLDTREGTLSTARPSRLLSSQRPVDTLTNKGHSQRRADVPRQGTSSLPTLHVSVPLYTVLMFKWWEAKEDYTCATVFLACLCAGTPNRPQPSARSSRVTTTTAVGYPLPVS